MSQSKRILGEEILRATRRALTSREDLQQVIDHIMDPLRNNLLPEPNDFEFRQFFIRTSSTGPQAILWELEAIGGSSPPDTRFFGHDIDTLVRAWRGIVARTETRDANASSEL